MAEVSKTWSWGAWRNRALRASVHRCAVIFPFEESYYRERGIDATFVGHPLLDQHAAVLQSGDVQREGLLLIPGSRPQEIRKAQADLTAAEARAEDAEIYLQRLQAVNTGAVSRQDVDNAKAQKDVADAILKSAQETLSLVQEGPREEDIAAARAILLGYQAELSLAEKNLTDANLISPEAAIVQERLLEPGDMASPQTPAYILALMDPIWVRVFVSEADLGKISPGMEATVRTDSFPDKSYPAWVGYISPTAEFTPKSVETEDLRTSLVYQVRVYVRNPQNDLRLGMPVTVTIDLAQSN